MWHLHSVLLISLISGITGLNSLLLLCLFPKRKSFWSVPLLLPVPVGVKKNSYFLCSVCAVCHRCLQGINHTRNCWANQLTFGSLKAKWRACWWKCWDAPPEARGGGAAAADATGQSAIQVQLLLCRRAPGPTSGFSTWPSGPSFYFFITPQKQGLYTLWVSA